MKQPVKPQIWWEKWQNPYEIDADDSFLPNDEDDTEYKDEKTSEMSGPIKALFTPLGIIPLTDDSSISKKFNFWVGHCNYVLIPYVARLFENVDGVETLDIWTKYRFRVGFGKLFEGQDRDIMFKIQLVFSVFWNQQNEVSRKLLSSD